MDIDKWLVKIYDEENFGRSIAITISGSIGLACYLFLGDAIIAFFSLIISFPLLRVAASFLNEKWKERVVEAEQKKAIERRFDNFSSDEIEVIQEFIRHGGSVLTFPFMKKNKISLSDTGVRSLINRRILSEGFVDDGNYEGLTLDVEIYDMARMIFRHDIQENTQSS